MASPSPPWKSYQEYLDIECLKTVSRRQADASSGSEASLSVGIIGGGMAGLYSALLLQKHIPGVRVKVFEANDRVGGRVYTHKFSSEPYQYFDTGAMRLPNTENQKPVFSLIDHINRIFPNDQIVLQDFINSCPEGNRLFYNNTRQKNGCIMSADYANKHCSELGFPGLVIEDSDSAGKLMKDAMMPVISELTLNFHKAMKKYASFSVYEYLLQCGWNHEKVKYVESMVVSNNFLRTMGLLDFIFWLGMYEDAPSWKTISGGMFRLPTLCAEALRSNEGEIKLGSKIEAIVQESEDGPVMIGYRDVHGKQQSLTYESFDAIIVTIPPPHIRIMTERPYMGPDRELALSAASFLVANKIGMRFKTRFWESPNLQLPPSLGGRSSTDLPIRTIVYPSHGIGDSGKGVLCIYNVLNDTCNINLMTKHEKINLMLQNLQVLYPEVNIRQEYAGGDDEGDESFLKETFIQDWSIINIMYHAGEFFSLYPKLVRPHGNIYFAGSHLTPNPNWILGALESAKRAVLQLETNRFGTGNVDYL